MSPITATPFMVSRLIKEFFRKAPSADEAVQRNRRYVRELRALGKAAQLDLAQQIFDNIHFVAQQRGSLIRFAPEYGSPVFYLLLVACELAQSRHAADLGEILIDNGVMFDSCGGERQRILECLAKLKSSSALGWLDTYIIKLEREAERPRNARRNSVSGYNLDQEIGQAKSVRRACSS